MDLAGKVALLTGAKRIGAIVAEMLARAGADVALVYNRSAKEAGTTVAAAHAMGRRAIAIQTNLAKPDECRGVVDATLAELGRIDVFVAMAGLYTGTPFSDLTVDIWNEQMDIELRSAF